jgi:hypothetical protein
MTNALEPTNLTTSVIDVTGQGNYRSTISNRFATQWTNGFNSSNSTNFPLLGGQTSLPVAWIPIRQDRRIRVGSAATTNVQVARMAFYVQDLQGLIDAERMGGEANRITGTNPAEISLTNLSGTALTNTGTASNFVATTNRRLYASVGMLRSTGGLTTNDLRYVATGLRSWGWMANNADSFSNRIPPGILIAASTGYTNAGQVKFDLNTNLTAGSLGNLVSILSSNLPGFTNRAGGFPPNAYFSSLAASIIDYADTGSQPTYTNVAATDVRGMEALPFVNERVTYFNLVRTNSAVVGTNNGIMLTILTQDFYEFWNPHSKPTPAVTLSLVASNSLGFTLGFSTFNFNNPTSATNSAGQAVLAGTTTNTFSLPVLPANGFLVTNSLLVTNNFFYPNSNPPTFPGTYNGNTNFFRYSVYVGSVATTNLYDRTQVGCYLAANANVPLNLTDTAANRRYFGSYSAFSAQAPLGTFRTSVGDPRMMFYINDNQDQITYSTGSSFGGRNVRGNIATNNNYSQVSVPFWPDGGKNSPAGTSAGNNQPTAVALATYSNAPPGRISDAGSYSNVCELGAVLDPIQWRDSTFRTTGGFGSETNGGQWTLLTTNTNAVPDNRFGGGTTLRIGRPEHPRFAFTNFGGDPIPNMGMSAAALLDLFRIGGVDSNSFTGGGKINLNTAPAPVLAALAGGVALSNDPGMAGSPSNATMTNAFVLGVLRFRQLYPLYSPSQLPFISTDYGVGAWTNTWTNTAVFGTNQSSASTNGLAGITALNDAGREEWFSKIYGLSGVDSLNFRCYVIAQLTDVNGNPRGAPYRKYYQIYIVPYPQTPAFSAVVVEEGSY